MSRPDEMPLLADGVGFGDPFFKFSIDVRQRGETEMVDVVSRRNGVDATETRMLQPAGQNDMTVHPAGTGGDLGEGHADLKGDAGFFRQNGDRAASSRGLKHGVEDRAD